MFKKSIWTSFASLAFAIQSLLTNKLFSIYFGPQGVTLLAHFQNIVAIFLTVPNEGVNRGVIRFLADDKIDNKQWSRYFNAALLLNALSFLAGILFLILFYRTLVTDFPAEMFNPVYISLFFVGIVLHFISIFIINIFLANSYTKAYSLFSILSNVLGICLIWKGLQNGMVSGLIYVCFAPSTVLVFMAIYFVKINRKRLAEYYFTTDKTSLLQIGSFVLTALSGVILGRAVDFFVRAYIIDQYQLYQTGLWQGVVKISDGYSTVFNAAFGMLFFVKISSLINEPENLRAFVRKSILYITLISSLGLTAVWLLKAQILTLLYNPDFLQAQNLMDFQLLGDLFKFPSWILGFLLLSKLETGKYIFAQFASATVYCILIWFLIPIFGLQGLPIAHFIRFVFYLVLMICLTRKLIF
jgi:PST family polysaccharide transporter